MDGRAPGRCRRGGFTLTELLTVVGLVALLVALFLPVLSRVRATAASAACLSNLKQIGTAWTMSVHEEHGRLPDYAWHTPLAPDAAWHGYWTAAMDRYKVPDRAVCPAAREPADSDTIGFGDARHAWTGRYEHSKTAIKLDPKTYRTGSYGYNRWMTRRGAFGPGGKATYLNDVRNPSNVPLFIDSAHADTQPLNGNKLLPAESPPDLTGTRAAEPSAPEHWKFIMARHGRGVNVYRADGSAAWVRLEELYLLQWKDGWDPYLLSLPRH